MTPGEEKLQEGVVTLWRQRWPRGAATFILRSKRGSLPPSQLLLTGLSPPPRFCSPSRGDGSQCVPVRPVTRRELPAGVSGGIHVRLGLQMPEEEAFCVFVRLMQEYRLRELFKPSMAELGLCIYQFEYLLQVGTPPPPQEYPLGVGAGEQSWGMWTGRGRREVPPVELVSCSPGLGGGPGDALRTSPGLSWETPRTSMRHP